MEFTYTIIVICLQICLSHQQNIVPGHKQEVCNAIETQELLKYALPEIRQIIQRTSSSEIVALQRELSDLKSSMKGRLCLTCPEGWEYHDTHCYLFSTTGTDWSTAKSECQKKAAYFVAISSEDENDFLISKANSYNVDFWIGATDQISEGTWVWENIGTDVMAGFTHWGTGQPDGLERQSCAVLWTTIGFNWDDQSCSNKLGFICEKAADVLPLQ